MTKQISRRGLMPDHHIKLVSMLEKKGLVVMGSNRKGFLHVVSKDSVVLWDINTGTYQSANGDVLGRGIKHIIHHLGCK